MKRTVKSTSAADDDMPEVDLKRAKVIGVGVYFKKLAAEHRYVQLDPDVYKEFKSPADVNEALRMVKQIRRLGRSQGHRKSA